MGRYYNKTRGVLPVTLASGAPMSVPAKAWVTIEAAEENSSSIANAIRRGFLVRSSIPDEDPVTPVVQQPLEKIEVPNPVVAEIKAVVQNQTPKSESLPKPEKAQKVDAAADKITDEPKRKRE